MLKENTQEVFIIILNWNGWPLTKQCLESLYNSSTKKFIILLVDNGSKDDCHHIRNWASENSDDFQEYSREQALQVYFKSIEKPSFRLALITNGENLGFAKANNVGIKIALNNKARYVLLLNNDTIVTNNALALMLSFIESNSRFVAVVPQIRYVDPPDTIWCCGGELNGFYEYYHYKGKSIKDLNVKLEGFKEITFGTGCALLFNVQQVGLLTEKFFFGEEDFELSLRLKKSGKKMACVLDAVIYHNESASINKSSRYLNKIFLHKLNRFIDIKTYAPKTWLFRITYRSFKFFLLHLFVEKTGLIKAVKNAFLLFKLSLRLNEVNKQTFEAILKLDLN